MKWYRMKKYRPQHHKQKMLALRRYVSTMTPDHVLRHLNYRPDVTEIFYLVHRSIGFYSRSEITRVVLSVHKDLVRRLRDLVVYW